MEQTIGWRPAERITEDNVEDAFTYQMWTPEQVADGQAVRDVLVAAVKVILKRVPESPMRTRAINNIVDARMIANAAITFQGRF